jgi:hypothetical protein
MKIATPRNPGTSDADALAEWLDALAVSRSTLIDDLRRIGHRNKNLADRLDRALAEYHVYREVRRHAQSPAQFLNALKWLRTAADRYEVKAFPDDPRRFATYFTETCDALIERFEAGPASLTS